MLNVRAVQSQDREGLPIPRDLQALLVRCLNQKQGDGVHMRMMQHGQVRSPILKFAHQGKAEVPGVPING
ncbi:hypothetical protein D3C75_1300110 [compost metagenome]